MASKEVNFFDPAHQPSDNSREQRNVAADSASRTVKGGRTEEEYRVERQRASWQQELIEAQRLLEALKSTPAAAYDGERERLRTLISELEAKLDTK